MAFKTVETALKQAAGFNLVHNIIASPEKGSAPAVAPALAANTCGWHSSPKHACVPRARDIVRSVPHTLPPRAS